MVPYVVGFCWVYVAYRSITFALFTDSFIDPPRDKNDPIVYLSSIVIEKGTIPDNWPFASTLESDSSEMAVVIRSTPNVNVVREKAEESMYLKSFRLQLFIVKHWNFFRRRRY